jgi:hypothetical protein
VSTASSSQILTLDISMDDAVFVEESKRHQNLSHRQRDLQLGKPLSSRLPVMFFLGQLSRPQPPAVTVAIANSPAS